MHTNSRSPRSSGALPLPMPSFKPGGNTRYGLPSARRCCNDLAACTFGVKASRHANTILPVHMVISEWEALMHRICEKDERTIGDHAAHTWCLGSWRAGCFVMISCGSIVARPVIARAYRDGSGQLHPVLLLLLNRNDRPHWIESDSRH